jgi:hypothetical protein
MNNSDSMQLATIDRSDLETTVGGDFWGDYTSKLGKDWNDVTYRYNEALKYNGVNGHTDVGKFLYNYGGTVADTGKTVWDASLGTAGKAIGALFK